MRGAAENDFFASPIQRGRKRSSVDIFLSTASGGGGAAIVGRFSATAIGLGEPLDECVLQ